MASLFKGRTKRLEIVGMLRGEPAEALEPAPAGLTEPIPRADVPQTQPNSSAAVPGDAGAGGVPIPDPAPRKKRGRPLGFKLKPKPPATQPAPVPAVKPSVPNLRRRG